MGVKPPKSWPEAVVKFMKERAGNVSINDTKQRLAWLYQYLGEIRDIREINRDMMDTIMQKRGVSEKTPQSENSTANRYVACVTAILNAACRDWDWIERSPRLKTYPEPSGSEKWLSVEEWKALESELPPHLLGPATFALGTGLRKAKVFGLEWSQIDLKRRCMTFKGTANKSGNTIPLNDTAMRAIEMAQALPVRHVTYVFTYEGQPLGSYGRAWYNAVDRAGLDVNWHAFRHTFASWLGQEGVPEGIIDRLGGWNVKKKATRERYTHLAVEHLRPHAAVIDRLLSSESQKSGNHTTHSAAVSAATA